MEEGTASQEDKLPLGRSQGRLGLQFTNPGTFQLLKDLLMAPMATGRTAYDLFILAYT